MLSGIIAVLLMFVFIAVWWWAWRPQRKQDFDRAARLALDEDSSADDSNGEAKQ